MQPLGAISTCELIAQVSVVVVCLLKIIENPLGRRHSARGGRFVDGFGSVSHLFVLLGEFFERLAVITICSVV